MLLLIITYSKEFQIMNVEKGLVSIALFLTIFCSVLIWRDNNSKNKELLLAIYRDIAIGLIGYLAKPSK